MNKKSGASNQFHGVGRRKSSVARVWIKPGAGTIMINGRKHDQYFDTAVTRKIAEEPFNVTGLGTQYEVKVNVKGGGISGQAGAVRLGLARAILEGNENLRSLLKKHKLLHCDARVKERKKYGQRGARRKFQFVKR